jgi:hypothetical protein
MTKKNKLSMQDELPPDRVESVSDLGHCEQVQWTTPDGLAGGYTRPKLSRYEETDSNE